MAGPTIKVEGLAEAVRDVEGATAQVFTSAMRGTTGTLKSILRQQITDAGMGTRLANTWRAETYPSSRDALTPTAFAWSKAPDIVDAFSRGATIRPLGGKKYLWIPTKNVPRQGGRGSSKRMTPDEVDVAFNQDLIIRNGRGGRKLAFISAVRGKNKRGGYRRVTKGRIAQGRDAELVLMFVLVPTVKLPRKFDLDEAVREAAADFVTRVQQEAAA